MTEKVDEKLKPYFVRKNESSIENGILFWGYRVVIPEKGKIDILNEIHASSRKTSRISTT